jgi:DNA mismatch repair protein MutS2
MDCDTWTLERLEYPRLQQLLAGQTQSEPGRQAAEQLRPLPEQQAVEQALSEVDEALTLLQAGDAPALGDCHDLRDCLAQVRAEGRLLGGEELQRIERTLGAMRACRSWFKQSCQTGELVRLATSLELLDQLYRRLRECIGPRGEIEDSASFVLADLRSQLRNCRERIKQRLERLLQSEQYAACFQERLITQRNGRYVVPLKSDYRGRIKGFVQDESASGQTLFLEPALVLEDNNRLQQLLREEQREERRILLELAALVRRDRAALELNQRLLARIDLRFAAARLSQQYRGCRPQLVDGPCIELRQARHPLLLEKNGRSDPEAAVAIDLLLPEECRTLVISGPNTGGKSVALKTLGLLQLMLSSGLHLPCAADSRMHLYRRLQVSIGDEQSIAASLSTFSGHLLRLRDILSQADEETLVLLDEAGSGTDPAEGAALIQALLEQLCRQGAKTLVTTHLGQLKHFAHEFAGIENAAVEFDPETLAPTYRLRYGIPGASSALTTARRLGLPEALLERAIAYLGNKEHDYSRLLAQLNSQQQQLDEQLKQVEKMKSEAAASQKMRRDQLQRLRARKGEVLQRARRQAEELIASTQAQLKDLRRRAPAVPSPQQASADKQQLQQARDRLQPFRPKPKRPGKVPDQLRAGELVRLVALGVEAEVVQVGTDKVDLLVNGKRLRQPLTALEQFQPRRFAAACRADGQVTRQLTEREPSSRLKLVGQRVDEALAQLEPFIDAALLSQLSRVEIIHGAGEGVLRRAVRDFLAEQRAVSAFYAAPADQGGDNITIAELNGT